MAKTLQFRRGTTAELDAITGAEGELFVDLDKNALVVMDGSTQGGHTLQPELLSGTNIKTVNGASLVGSGDVDLSTNLALVGNELRYTNIDGTLQTVDLSQYLDDTTNTIVSGTLNGNNITFTREDATTFTVDVAALYDDTNLVTSVNGNTGAVTVQETLASGTNIKTVDGNSILGSGNIAINNKSITLSGDVSGSGTTSISVQLGADVVGANELNVSGNGTSGQVLSSDADGSFTWIDAASGGSSYDQNLNTTDSVTFDSLTVTSNAVIPTAEGAPEPGVWSSGGNLITGKSKPAGAGTQTAALSFGGYDETNSGTTSTEEYNGAAWASGGNLLSAKTLHAGAGTQTAALAIGGDSGSGNEQYNGTSWSSSANTNFDRYSHAAAGTQNAALTFGGFDVLPSEEYDGTSWSVGADILSSRQQLGGFGTQTAAVLFGGEDYNTFNTTSSTEEYNGTSWSVGPNLIAARQDTAGAGTQDAGLVFGGRGSSFQILSSTEEYNGTSWSSGGNLINTRKDHAGAGTKSAALAFGGEDGTTNEFGQTLYAGASTEEYSAGTVPPSSTGTVGEIRYNAVTGVFEGYGVSQWDSFNSAPVSLFSLPDTDITSPANGQSLVYNSSTEKWENSNYTQVPAVDTVVGDGAWSSGGNLITGRTDHAGAGTQTAALAFGGGDTLASTEEYDGTSWTAGGNLGTARYNHSGAGTQTAALAFGGQTNDGASASTEEYDGTTWTAGGNLITARFVHAGAGTQTAALAFGGDSPIGVLNTTEEYNGASWSSGGNLSTGRFGHAGAGTQTAALAFGGLNQAFTLISSTEEYDGTSWSSGGNLSTARFNYAGAGTQTAALAFGGQDSSFSTISSTEKYDGTSWTADDNLGTARAGHAGAGTQTAALAFGGNGPLSSTEEYDVTIQPPSSTGTVGEIRYNEATGVFEGYTGTQWVALSTAV